MKKIPVMLAILLGFALLSGFVSCDNGTTDDDQFSELLSSLSSGYPSGAALTTVGLTSSKLGNITVATGTYRGYMVDDFWDNAFDLVWTGANLADYEAVKNAVASELSAHKIAPDDDTEEKKVVGYYYSVSSVNYTCWITYVKTGFTDGVYYPAGCLIVGFNSL